MVSKGDKLGKNTHFKHLLEKQCEEIIYIVKICSPIKVQETNPLISRSFSVIYKCVWK